MIGLAELGTAYVQILPSMRGMSASISRQLGAGADAASSSMGSRIKSGLGGAFKAVGGLAVGVMSAAAGTIAANMGAAVSRVDTLNNFPRQMQNMGFSAKEASKAIKDLDNGTKGLPTSLDSIVASAQQFIALPMFSSMEDATKTTLALNNAFLAAGASAADTARGTQQVAQMFATGKPDLMSWRTVMETMPAQLSQVSKEMLGTGASSMDLYEALQSGKISMTDFKDALIRMNEEGGNGFASFAQQAKDATKGIKTSLTNMRTSIVRNLANFLDQTGLSDQIIEYANKVSAGIDRIGNFAIYAFNGLRGADLGGVFAGIAPAAGGLLGVVSPLLAKIPLLGGAFEGLTGPIGLAVGAIVGMFQNSAALRQAFSNLLTAVIYVAETIGGVLAQAMGILGPLLGAVGNALAPILNTIAGFMPTIDLLISNLADALMPLIQSFITSVLPSLQNMGLVVSQLLQAIFNALVPIINLIVARVMPVIQAVLPVVSTVITSIMGVVQPALSVLTNIINFFVALLQGDFSGAWTALQGIISGVWNVITGIVTGAVNIVSSILSGAWHIITSLASQAWNGLTGILSNAWNSAKNAVSRGISSVIGLVKTLPRRVLSALGNLGRYLFNSGKALLTGFKDGIMSVFSGIGNAVKGGLAKIRSFFPFSPAKQGPFSGKGWVLYSGMAIGNAMAEGIERSGVRAVGSARNLARQTQAALALSSLPNIAANTAAGRLAQAGAAGGTSVSNHFEIRSDNPELVARMVAERLYRRAA